MVRFKPGSFVGTSLGALLALSACGGGAAPAASSPAAVQASKPAATGSAAATTSGKFSPEVQALIDGAKKETVIKGVWSESSFGGSQGFQELVDAVNKKYGLNVKGQFTPGPDMQSLMGKIIQEVAAGQPSTSDVVLGNSQAVFDSLPSKALKPVEWSKIVDRPVPGEAGFEPFAPGNVAVTIATSVTGVTYNSKLIPADQVPHKLNDLLDPKWKGKMASTPYAAGFRDFAAPDVMGKEAVADYVRKFSKQISGLMRCGEYDRISSGEFQMLSLDCGHDGAFTAQRQGAPVSQVILDDVTSLHMRYAAIPATSSAPNTAALLISYILSAEGQAHDAKYDGMDLHTFPDAKTKDLVAKVRSGGGKFWTDTVQNLQVFSDYSKNQQLLQDILSGKQQ